MSVTRKNVADYFYLSVDYVKQIDRKQLFIINLSSSIKLLVSYRTIVGVKLIKDNVWCLTLRKYSVTTTKQMNQFARNQTAVIWLDSETFSDLYDASLRA